MKKKVLLTLMVCLASLSVCAQRFSYTYKGVEFKCKVERQRVCITSFDTKADVVIIPAHVSYKGMTYPVKSVSTFLNGNNYLATSLELEEGIEEIDKFSFNEFRKLRTLTLPSTILNIGKNAFRLNPNTRVNLPNTINYAALEKGNEIFVDGTIFDNPQTGMLLTQSDNSQKAEKKDDKRREQLEQIKKEREQLKREREELMAQANALADMAANTSPAAQVTPQKMKSGSVLGNMKGVFSKKKDKSNGSHAQLAQAASPAPATAAVEQKAAPTLLADVDVDIPSRSSKEGENLFCVIIANEKYIDVPEVEFAAHDGEIFKEYCMKTLNVPEKHIRTFLNASFTDMKRALNWLDNMATVTAGTGKFIFYYAGHGVPSEKDNSAYLIPADGFPKDITTCFKLSDIYARLGAMNAESVTCFLDACFSGVKRGEGSALVASRGVAVKAKKESLTGNLIVISAASDDETAYSYKEKGHGMFTYYLLKKLKDSKGNTSLGELFEAISSNVMRSSMIENDKLQTPSVNTSINMKEGWKKLRF